MASSEPSPSQPQIEADVVIRNIGQLVTVAQSPIAGAYGALQIIDRAAIAVHDGVITWIGHDDESGSPFRHETPHSSDGITIIDAHEMVLTPGFVDSHTHLIFAGDRAQEFHLRRAGTSYGELLAQGRGILTTMKATREASMDILQELAQQRLESMRQHGSTTIEVKTGYGLNIETEKLCLQLIANLNQQEEEHRYHYNVLRLVPTFLGAHSVPPEYKEQRAQYIDLLVNEMLPAFVGLSRFCDVFCEREAFTLEESRHILTQAKALGYQLKLHADQLSPSGGARLAAELGAVSADHLDYASDEDLQAMRAAHVVATLLPGCSYTLRSPYPVARRFLDAGLQVALATDFNPGTSYCENMQMILGLAMSDMSMSLEEALQAVTINGARALALQDQIGSIEVGKRCELAQWALKDYHEIGYHFGVNLIQSLIVVR